MQSVLRLARGLGPANSGCCGVAGFAQKKPALRASALQSFGVRNVHTDDGEGSEKEQEPKDPFRFKNKGAGKLEANSLGSASLRITPGENQDTVISFENGASSEKWAARFDERGAVVNLSGNDNTGTAVVDMPYRSDIILKAPLGSIEVSEYLEGDLLAHSGKGIRVKKVRGNTVELECSGAAEVIKDLEAVNLSVFSKSFSTRKLLAQFAEVLCSEGNVKIQAAYVDDATINAQGDGNVSVKGFHGSLVVRGRADVELLGVNGALDLEIEKGNVVVQFDSLSESTPCRIVTKSGSVNVTLPLDQQVYIESESESVEKLPKGIEVSGNLARGTFAGTPEPNRATHRAAMSGKVNIDETKTREALWGMPKGSDLDGGSLENDGAQLFITAPKGSVKIEAISWIERIRNRFIPPSETA